MKKVVIIRHTKERSVELRSKREVSFTIVVEVKHRLTASRKLNTY